MGHASPQLPHRTSAGLASGVDRLTWNRWCKGQLVLYSMIASGLLLAHYVVLPLLPVNRAVHSSTLMVVAAASILYHTLAMHSDPGFVQPGDAASKLPEGFSTCRKCSAQRPPRAHHCRHCDSCVLRFDHHCWWIDNCVGLYNHKYFLLWLSFSTAFALHVGTLITLAAYHVFFSDNPPPFSWQLAAVFLYLIALFVTGGIALIYCVSQYYLLSVNKTTVETYINPATRLAKLANSGMSPAEVESHIRAAGTVRGYNIGCWGNTRAVCGDNIWTWLLPLRPALPIDNDTFYVWDAEGF
eukprot:TRINITY_DN67679_c0_g1_i1.p1 TRINITY_DN67679_c0_g1~~TRINITY_DN67679_c0_g1_i1.p1  ORF type:complete len:309 (+),score=29.19 TRINITY_DN67679_c0_g1_i1:35-928(+)